MNYNDLSVMQAERDTAVAEVERLKAQNIEIAIRFNCKDTECKSLREALEEVIDCGNCPVCSIAALKALGRNAEAEKIFAALATGGHDDNA